MGKKRAEKISPIDGWTGCHGTQSRSTTDTNARWPFHRAMAGRTGDAPDLVIADDDSAAAIAPVYNRWVLKSRRSKAHHWKLFPLLPGYIFAGVHDGRVLRGVRGMRSVVRIGGAPLPIPFRVLSDFLAEHHHAFDSSACRRAVFGRRSCGRRRSWQPACDQGQDPAYSRKSGRGCLPNSSGV